MKCPNCGADNDAANRFCDQCGSRLEPSGASAQAPAAVAAQPTASGATCPNCGAAVLPGEAFCDECGTALSGVAVASASNDAPTMYAPPMPDGGASPGDAQGTICPACGHQNLPGDSFCDNCGAALNNAQPATSATIVNAPAAQPSTEPATQSVSSPAAESMTEPAPDSSTKPSDDELLRSLNASPPGPPAEAAPASAPSAATEQPAASSASLPSQDQIPLSEQSTVEQPALTLQDYEAEQKRLQEEIARQQQIIVQFEQMQATFGAATPPAVTQGLSDARTALAHTQAEFDALRPPAPAIDPSEVARLNEEIARQQQIIAQFEQMQTTFGAATPAVVTQGLSDARAGKARAEADLAALGAGSAQATSPSALPPSTIQVEAVPAQPATPEPPSAPPAEGAAAPPVAAPVTASTGPRLVLNNGSQELPLPTDKREIIIGREDPISGIFPEIDLTPYGGESGGVSRQHARINHDGDQWTITDLNSTNYTRVDGAKIDPSLPVPLKDGSQLQFGRVAATFHV